MSCAILGALGGCETPPVTPIADPAARGQIVSIPMIDGDGLERHLVARICRPPGPGPFRIAVINHGYNDSDAKRADAQPYRCTMETTRWFTDRKIAVVYPVRRGYGPTGGSFDEYDGPCDGPDFVGASRETARDIAASVRYATHLPDAMPGGVIVIGHSGAGWGVVAYDAMAHAGARAIIDMAGGRGTRSSAGEVIGHCSPGALIRSARLFGSTATTPMLWVYAASDPHFPPDYAAALHDAFVAGGGQADFVDVDTHSSRLAHGLFLDRGGAAFWGPPVDAYLRARFGARLAPFAAPSASKARSAMQTGNLGSTRPS